MKSFALYNLSRLDFGSYRNPDNGNGGACCKVGWFEEL